VEREHRYRDSSCRRGWRQARPDAVGCHDGQPEDALAAVRFYLAPECDVELTDYRISAETIRALGLVPGEVRQL
jgi:hypothetical protein